MTGGYVDGFMFAVPKKNTAAYTKMAKEACKVWKKFGAISYYECMGEDLEPKAGPDGKKPRSFMKAAAAKEDEVVWFSFIVFKNRAHRDQVNKKVMAYFDKKYADMKDFTMPFDVRRMAYGGFKAEVKA